MLKKELLREFIRENNLTTAQELQQALKELFASTLQEMLEAELEDHLGYSKYDYKNKTTKNSRNGSTTKKVLSDFGEVSIAIPRDREGEFEPKAIKKYQNDISGIEDKVLGMYAKGMSTRDIASHLEELYGMEASPTLISKITEKIMPIAQEWQNRPLEPIYPIIFFRCYTL
jgi:Transposase and inactivated derivatives